MNTSIEIGKAYIIRSVTHMWTGKVVAITDAEIVLDTCAWIADSGRWANAIKEGTLNEVEPMGDGVAVFRGGLIDATPWVHELPTTQK
jgi:hypothetical protein